jgi:rSAM/selenodomain-associated transferase 2
MAGRLSIIIPTLDERAALPALLDALQAARAAGHELIVVDGGSRDGSADIAVRCADRVLASERGRARQMNTGAAVARGDILWFLHADTLPPSDGCAAILAALADGRHLWGRFDVRFTGRHSMFAVVARAMNLRSRLTGLCTGDQALFVTRAAFAQAGGFPEQPLMEDIALSRALKRLSRPARIATPVVTSSRRWERRGVLRTILLMWWLRLAYWLGVSPARLARWYG